MYVRNFTARRDPWQQFASKTRISAVALHVQNNVTYLLHAKNVQLPRISLGEETLPPAPQGLLLGLNITRPLSWQKSSTNRGDIYTARRNTNWQFLLELLLNCPVQPDEFLPWQSQKPEPTATKRVEQRSKKLSPYCSPSKKVGASDPATAISGLKLWRTCWCCFVRLCSFPPRFNAFLQLAPAIPTAFVFIGHVPVIR